MKLKSARFGVLLVALAGILATMVPSAQATTRKTITFTGAATLDTGFVYPCTNPAGTTDCTRSTTTTKAGPKPGTTVVNHTPVGGRTTNFRFNSTVCVKTSVSTSKTGTLNKTGTHDCVITASGTVTGFCGLSTGAGTATITNLGPTPPGTGSPTKASTTTVFKFTSTGGVLHVTGGSPNTNIVGDVNATPTPNTGSCTPAQSKAGATQFTITGEIVYKNCTKTPPSGVPCV